MGCFKVPVRVNGRVKLGGKLMMVQGEIEVRLKSVFSFPCADVATKQIEGNESVNRPIDRFYQSGVVPRWCTSKGK